jgi:hypothetical protein
MRSGTTALIRYLDAHPDVFVATPKEVHFFDMHFERGLDWYAKHFEAAGGASAIGEGTPRYMYDKQAVERIADVVPDAKLLVSLRDPVDRAYSHYWMNRSLGREPMSFVEALSGEGQPNGLSKYEGPGHYIVFLERLLRYFPRTQLHVVLFDELRLRPARAYADIAEFIGVDSSISPAVIRQPVNAYQEYRSSAVARVARKLPKRAGNAIGRVNRRAATYPPLDEDVRRELASRFADSNKGLADWLGADLTGWSSP